MSLSKLTSPVSPLINDDNSIYSLILNDISNSVFVSGDRLVTTALAKKYNTSITPVREALKQLQGEGFVSVEPNSGARVTRFEYTTMRDTLEILQLLEPYLMEWFVNEYTDEDFKQLTETMEQMEVADDLTFRRLDTEFHWQMYKNHYNQSAVNLWRKKRIALMAIHSNVSLNPVKIAQSISEHKDIMAALKDRDVDKTLASMSKHLTSSTQYWSRYVGKAIR